jgi:hypothetical protein
VNRVDLFAYSFDFELTQNNFPPADPIIRSQRAEGTTISSQYTRVYRQSAIVDRRSISAWMFRLSIQIEKRSRGTAPGGAHIFHMNFLLL